MQAQQRQSVWTRTVRKVVWGGVLAAGLMLPRSAQPESGFNGIARMRPGDVVIGSHPQHGDPSQYIHVRHYREMVERVNELGIQREHLRIENKRLRRENARLKTELQALKPDENHGHHRILQ